MKIDMKINMGFVANSSSECFICNTNLSPKQVKRKLEIMLEMYNKLTVGPNKAAGAIMGKPFLEFDKVFSEPRIATEGDIEDMGYCDFGRNEVASKIFLRSASENSIPWELFDLIESVFNACRAHRG